MNLSTNKVLMASLRYAQILLTQNFIKTIIAVKKAVKLF